jgi:hypothetical protein
MHEANKYHINVFHIINVLKILVGLMLSAITGIGPCCSCLSEYGLVLRGTGENVGFVCIGYLTEEAT